MNLIKNIFFFVFITSILVTSVPFTLFDTEELTNIQLIEEENEESTIDSEIALLDMVNQILYETVNGFQDYEANHFQEFHAQKKYKSVYISVLYSPPDLS